MYLKLLILVLTWSAFCYSGLVIAALPPQKSGKFFPFSIGYRMPVTKNPIINSGHGICLEAGFNMAGFFSQEKILGLYAGWGWRDHFWSTSFDGSFIRDYSSSINHEAFTGSDSAAIHLSKELIAGKKGRSVPVPGCETNSFHDYSLYYGFIFRISQQSPVLKLYTGSARSHYLGPGAQGTDYTIFQLRRRAFGTELMLADPLQYFPAVKKYPALLKRAALSIYYECRNFQTSSLYFSSGAQQSKIPLSDFMSSSFLSKYKTEQICGFKLSYVIL